jgi:hypothetical protein
MARGFVGSRRSAFTSGGYFVVPYKFKKNAHINRFRESELRGGTTQKTIMSVISTTSQVLISPPHTLHLHNPRCSLLIPYTGREPFHTSSGFTAYLGRLFYQPTLLLPPGGGRWDMELEGLFLPQPRCIHMQCGGA